MLQLLTTLLLCASCAFCTRVDAGAAEPDAPVSQGTSSAQLPPPQTEYFGRRIAPTMHYAGAAWLVRESRQRQEEPAKLLGALHLKPGQNVCDLGCGNGFYSIPLAQRVGPKGAVWAVDIQQEMLDELAVRAKRKNLANIRLVRGTSTDPKLPKRTLDLVLLVDVYHEFSHPEQMLAAIRRSLKPTGRMVLVEFRAEDPEVPIKPLHKMSKKQILKEIPPNGFRLVEEFDDMPWQHVMLFAPASRQNAADGKSAGEDGKEGSKTE